ncbi:MAG: undecaprenyl-diphosphate phosphatase [Bacteroidales bacterium]|nr:undecaprenyl-diphosphate phosphatase [Bacteroidales bacterium]
MMTFAVAGETIAWWQAILLGLVQGLTEFLPVSSSGHLELGKSLLGIHTPDDLLFTVCVHGATVLSTMVVFWKDILQLLSGLFRGFDKRDGRNSGDPTACRDAGTGMGMNAETVYILKLIISMIPVALVGLFFKDEVESFFGNGVRMVGIMLLVTAVLLCLAQYLGKGRHEIRYKDAFIIGIAQAVAVR